MALYTKLAIFMFLVRTCELYEMYAEYSKNTILHFDQFWDYCPGFKQNNTFQILHLRAHGNQSNMLYDFEMSITSDFPKVRAMVLIEKCRSREALDTCVKLTSLHTDRICAMLESKHDFWSPGVQCINPKLVCHAKKGLYKGTDCGLNMSYFNFFPIPANVYWRTKLLLIAKGSKEILNCHVFSAKLQNKRQ